MSNFKLAKPFSDVATDTGKYIKKMKEGAPFEKTNAIEQLMVHAINAKDTQLAASILPTLIANTVEKYPQPLVAAASARALGWFTTQGLLSETDADKAINALIKSLGTNEEPTIIRNNVSHAYMPMAVVGALGYIAAANPKLAPKIAAPVRSFASLAEARTRSARYEGEQAILAGYVSREANQALGRSTGLRELDAKASLEAA